MGIRSVRARLNWRLHSLLAASAILCGAIGADEAAASTAKSSQAKARASFLWYEWYRSRPDLRPPKVRVASKATATSPGYVFLAAIPGPGQRGPMIVDNQGRLVWFKPLPKGVVPTDLRVQTYQGKPVLTWWQGTFSPGGNGCGVGIIADTSYRTIATVRPTTQGRYCPDLHEFRLTPRGSALMVSYRRAKVAGHTVLDGIFEDVDVATGRVLLRWSAAHHVSPFDSYVPPFKNRSRPWDYFHINSVDVDGNGDYLVSSRHTWTIFKLSSKGKIIWRLGGKHSSFKIPGNARFGWQHDARFGPNGTISLFDNSAGTGGALVRKFSTAFVLQLNEAARTVSVVKAFRHPSKLLAHSQGNVQSLPNGDYFVGWGQSARASEFSSDGRLLFDLQLSPDWGSYRAYRFPWVARPAERPRVAAVRSRGRVHMYMSWNGSTELARWEVLSGNSTHSMHVVASRGTTGFQTVKTVSPGARYYAAQALNSSGQVIGTSAAVTASG